MSVERIIVETNDETGNNPVEYDWEFDPDGTFHMSGDGEIPSAFEESAAIVDAFNHVNMSIVNGERTPLKDGDRSWFTLLAVTLATLIPFVEGKDATGGIHDGRYVKRLQRQYHVGGVPGLLPLHVDRRRCLRGFGRYLNFRWNTVREAWVEAGSGLAFIGADSQVAYMLETATSKGDSIRFDPMEGKEETVQLFRLLLETAKCADIPVRFAGGLRQGE